MDRALQTSLVGYRFFRKRTVTANSSTEQIESKLGDESTKRRIQFEGVQFRRQSFVPDSKCF